MARTLVTGAAGFTGRYLAKLLAERGDEVHGLVHEEPDDAVEGLASVHRADLADLAAVQRIVDEVRPEHVVHLAAIAFVAHDDVEQTCIAQTSSARASCWRPCRELPDSPRSVLLASSANVYGNSREGALDESLPAAPANDYGITKVAMEYLVGLYADRLPLMVVRPFNYTGPGQSDELHHSQDR